MERIIGGEKYNTETSEQLANVENGYDESHFKHISEILYRSPSGQLFIHQQTELWGEDSFSADETLFPINEDEAFEFCIENDLTKEAQELFPHLIGKE